MRFPDLQQILSLFVVNLIELTIEMALEYRK